MDTIRFLQTKPYLALLLVTPLLYGLAIWFGDRAVDLSVSGAYIVMENRQLSLLAIALLAALALLYRGAEVAGVRLSPVVPFLHVTISSFCLLVLMWTLNISVPSGQAIPFASLSARHDLALYLALLFGAMQLFLIAALLYELMRQKKD